MYLQESGAVRPCELSRVDAGAKIFGVDMSYALATSLLDDGTNWDKLVHILRLSTHKFKHPQIKNIRYPGILFHC